MTASFHPWVNLTLIVCGIAFASINLDKGRLRARWAKCVFIMTGILASLQGFFRIALVLHWVQLPSEASHRQMHVFLIGIGGAALGMIFALIVSGELLGKKSPSCLQ